MADGSPAVRTTTVDRSEERVGGWIRAWRLAAAVFIAYPLARIVLDPTEPVTAALALAATGLFAFIAFRLGRRSPDDPSRADPRMTAVVLAIIGLAAATCLRSPEPGWVVLFYYGSSAASFIAPDRRAMSLIVIAGLAAGLSLLPIEDVVSAIVQGVAVSVIGVTIFSLTALRRTNARLRAARQELAHVAVASERDRIARDLHDTLGHSLSLIAIKSELARRLLPDDPERARVEIADVERVARESLASVRVAVRGGLHPTLAGELAAAREVLDAAGIASVIDDRAGPMPDAADGVLAWAVREAVTNLVRHSGASHGAITTWRDGDEFDLEVRDDGVGDGSEPAPSSGSGLDGLRRRVATVGGRLEAGAVGDRGYRLFVAVPAEPSHPAESDSLA
jgi:two-component system, NarL family, sensor histidine kinase DesK